MNWRSALVGVVLALFAPVAAWAQCTTGPYPLPPGSPPGAMLFGNCATAATPLQPTDTVIGWQPGNPQGQRERGFQVQQLQQYIIGGTGGGPFLPLAGGTLPTLPTSPPSEHCVVWNNGGVLSISTCP